MDIKTLNELKHYVNMMWLSRETGMNKNTLYGKIYRNTELSDIESDALDKAMEKLKEIICPGKKKKSSLG